MKLKTYTLKLIGTFYLTMLKQLNTLLEALRAKPAMDIEERYSLLQDSAQTALCDYLMQRESEVLKQLARDYRGKKILLLSALEGVDIGQESPFQTVWKVAPSTNGIASTASLFARFDALPFDSASFDVVILQHVLEYSNNPQQVLKEAARITSHCGHTFIVGFNAASSHGICSAILGRLRPNSFWGRESLLIYRVKDWLEFLDFNHLKSVHLGHCLPIRHRSYLSVMQGFHRGMDKLNIPFSPVYCLVSRKEVPGMTGGKPNWKKVVLETALPVVRPAQSAGGLSKITHINKYNTD